MVWWLRKHRPDKRKVPIGPICIRFLYKTVSSGIFLLSGRCFLVNSLRQKNKRPAPISGMPCVGLDWFVPFFFASNRTGPVHFQTCIGLNRIDPGAALLYYVPDCTGLYRFFLCTGLYRLYYVPVCTGFVLDVSL